jgi:NADH:ubiquinone oxidoreductase subunit C
MSVSLVGAQVAEKINSKMAGVAIDFNETDVWVEPQNLPKVGKFLRDDSETDLQMLNSISAVDYVEYFELVYHFRSLRRNSTFVLKARCYGRDELTVPSLVGVWHGAELQEREIWDLMGIKFTDHPNLKRILLWEGFPGHPLRKDFIR